jgi:hypothetical protein
MLETGGARKREIKEKQKESIKQNNNQSLSDKLDALLNPEDLKKEQ